MGELAAHARGGLPTFTHSFTWFQKFILESCNLSMVYNSNKTLLISEAVLGFSSCYESISNCIFIYLLLEMLNLVFQIHVELVL